jgi:hypothetical protein
MPFGDTADWQSALRRACQNWHFISVHNTRIVSLVERRERKRGQAKALKPLPSYSLVESGPRPLVKTGRMGVGAMAAAGCKLSPFRAVWEALTVFRVKDGYESSGFTRETLFIVLSVSNVAVRLWLSSVNRPCCKWVHLNTVLGRVSFNRSLRFKAKCANEHLTPALSPFCYRKTRRGRDAPSVFLNRAADHSPPQTRSVSRYAPANPARPGIGLQ